MEQNSNIKFISWNVRGLNLRDKRLVVRQTILIEKPDLVCLKETKLSVMNDGLVKEICGPRLSEYRSLNAIGTRGGVLISCRQSRFSFQDQLILHYTLLVKLKDNQTGNIFLITGVYGPSASVDREDFFQEIMDVKSDSNIPWILYGGFNVTLLPQDRNTTSANWRGSMLFSDLISHTGLINLQL
jgi:exonuclease III